MPLAEAPVRDAAAAPGRGVRPVFIVGGLYSTANGVAWIMRDLAAALGRIGSPVTVCAADCPGRTSVGDVFEPPTRWVTARGRWLGGLSWSPALKPILEQQVRQCDVVHNHSVWMLPTSYASRIARRLDRPFLFTAHGTLEPWALAHSGWKKRLAAWAFQDRDLRQAACIHVNSEAEIAGVRAYGLKQPISVIPNGVDASLLTAQRSPALFRDRFPETGDRRILLFMARLHEKKGLRHLLEAWQRVERQFRDWQLAIAGPDCGDLPRLRSQIEALGIGSRVTVTGELSGELRFSALAAASAFVLPSFSEGFSMAILEAMACGLPVLMTPGCNFGEAARSGAAIEVAPDVESTARGLHLLLQQSDGERSAMGERGRRLVEAAYTWNRVAESTLRLYRWLMLGGPAPEFVVTA